MCSSGRKQVSPRDSHRDISHVVGCALDQHVMGLDVLCGRGWEVVCLCAHAFREHVSGWMGNAVRLYLALPGPTCTSEHMREQVSGRHKDIHTQRMHLSPGPTLCPNGFSSVDRKGWWVQSPMYVCPMPVRAHLPLSHCQPWVGDSREAEVGGRRSSSEARPAW